MTGRAGRPPASHSEPHRCALFPSPAPERAPRRNPTPHRFSQEHVVSTYFTSDVLALHRLAGPIRYDLTDTLPMGLPGASKRVPYIAVGQSAPRPARRGARRRGGRKEKGPLEVKMAVRV